MKKRNFIIILFSFWLLTSCAPAAPAGEEPAMEEPAAEESTAPEESQPQTIDRLFILESAVWTNSIIGVCWENPSERNESERTFIRTTIENSWEAVSLVDFVGWEACEPRSGGIRIQLNDASPRTIALGAQLDGMQNGMILNTSFEHWGCADTSGEQTPCIFPYRDYSKEDLIRITAVHEFGHALGFAHEQNRADTPSWCDAPQGTDGTMPIDGWDLDSVMNYCNPAWLGDGHLSAIDIAGAQIVYGAREAEKERRK